MAVRASFAAGLIVAALLGLCVVALAGCAHVQTVATDCLPTAEQAVLTNLETALAQGDSSYEAAVAMAAAGVAPCVIVATIQEIVDSLSRTRAAGLDAAVAERHGREWLATHVRQVWRRNHHRSRVAYA